MQQRMTTSQMSQAMQQCISNCTACHNICVETTRHCLELGGQHAQPSHITLLVDCAQICATSADFMLRHSNFHTRTCAVCAEVCEQCARDCERMAQGDQQMLACAEACRQCAQSCREMASMAA